MDFTAGVEEALLGGGGVAALPAEPAESGREPSHRLPRPRPRPRLSYQRPSRAEAAPPPAVSESRGAADPSPPAADTAAGRRGKPRRRLKVADLLREEGWTLKRRVKHYVYTKVFRGPDGTCHRLPLTMSATPSTRNHEVVQRAQLRRLERAAEEAGWVW
jgi:hypothetical protein